MLTELMRTARRRGPKFPEKRKKKREKREKKTTQNKKVHTLGTQGKKTNVAGVLRRIARKSEPGLLGN